MALVSLSNIDLAYGHVALLDKVELHLESGERVGLIGRNGTGKSSLLRIVAGQRNADDGNVVRQSGLRWAMVDQEPELDATQTILEAVAGGLSHDAGLLIAYEQAAARLAADETGTDTEALDELMRLQGELEAVDGWTMKSRLETALQRFALDGALPVASLSGGQKKRVALARALVAEPDLLLLDEPTNHLDFDAIRWLEELLRSFKGSVLFITHDRAFLDAVATRIVELDRGKLRSYPGNFTAYQIRKAEQIEIERIENAKFDKVLAQEEVWIRKGIEARRTRNEGRVRRLEALRRERSVRRDQVGQARLAVDAGERSGKLVAELTDVSKAYGTREIVSHFSATLMRGDKVGLIGANGTGKTTLLKLILGELAPDSGDVRLGTNLQVAYFDQMRGTLDLERSVQDTISPGSEWVEIGNERKHVMSYLGDFLFAPERARSPVKSLSGGERNRLLLARLFARPANVLVLDEPTNDLDIDTLELLEELLENYPGTVFLVSHDRVFLDNVVTQTIVHEGEGRWAEYVGGYKDWEAVQQRVQQSAQEKKLETKQGAKQENRPEQKRDTKPNAPAVKVKAAPKLSFKEQRELDGLPAKIEMLEQEQLSIQQQLVDPAIYADGPEKALKLNQRLAQLEQELTVCLERWETLDGR